MRTNNYFKVRSTTRSHVGFFFFFDARSAADTAVAHAAATMTLATTHDGCMSVWASVPGYEDVLEIGQFLEALN
jgi:hypothetical protein